MNNSRKASGRIIRVKVSNIHHAFGEVTTRPLKNILFLPGKASFLRLQLGVSLIIRFRVAGDKSRDFKLSTILLANFLISYWSRGT